MKQACRLFSFFLIMHSAFFINTAPLDKHMLDMVFSQHCAQLKNTSISHNPFVIAFSGTPGMGTTFVACKLEAHYQAVRISNNEIRALFNNLTTLTQAEREQALPEYLTHFLDHYKLPNQLFILDSSIDRKYQLIASHCTAKNIPLMVIRLAVPRETVIERIKQREGENASLFLKHLDKWFSDYEKFATQYTNYLTFTNTAQGTPFEELIKAIDHQMNAVKDNNEN